MFSLMLGQYLLDNPALISGRDVLELGSGVGFLGILTSFLNPASITMTDFNSSVLQRLTLNVALNRHPSAPKPTISRWDWANVTDAMIGAANPSLILGADVTYDPEGIDLLVDLLARTFALRKPNERRAMIACTVRNSDTFSHFLNKLGILLFKYIPFLNPLLDMSPGLNHSITNLSGDLTSLNLQESAKFYYEDTVSVVNLVLITPSKH
ncbi:hypothetical protein DSO57_1027006 [Entomophthora muscae]|uniref:Uncharacterized protein n=1 Tax=Entomophthora muscae TaxID=34485 RepID=A0ACC2SEQ5_9FUNG|nr:hypothetical protein DSO57_1027006 [Entomophthora muscae]